MCIVSGRLGSMVQFCVKVVLHLGVHSSSKLSPCCIALFLASHALCGCPHASSLPRARATGTCKTCMSSGVATWWTWRTTLPREAPVLVPPVKQSCGVSVRGYGALWRLRRFSSIYCSHCVHGHTNDRLCSHMRTCSQSSLFPRTCHTPSLT